MRLIIALLYIGLATPSLAQSPMPMTGCGGLTWESFPALQPGRIVGEGEVTLLPFLEKADWHRDSLAPGTWVAVTKAVQGQLCVEAAKGHPGGSRIIGWVPAKRVQLSPDRSINDLSWWHGSWRNRGSRIDIVVRKGTLSVSGGSVWKGGVSPSPHFGEFSGTAVPDGNVVTVADSDDDSDEGCKVRLVPIGDQIAAQDKRQMRRRQCHLHRVLFSVSRRAYRPPWPLTRNQRQ